MNTYGHDSLEKALVSAVELATEDLNDRLEYGQGLCEGRASRYKSSSLAQCLIIVQKFNKPTNTLLLQNPCYGQYGF